MNRRGFLATLSAIAAALGLKPKAPATDGPLYTIRPHELVGAGEQVGPYLAGDFRYFTDTYVYVNDKDGLYKWTPTSTQKHLLGFKPKD